MKICMIGHKTVPSRDGGVEIVVEELAKRMVKEGHDVTLFNRKRKNKPSEALYKGIKLVDIFTINKKSLDAIVYSYFATKKVIKLAKKRLFDVVHFHAEGPCNFLKKFGKIGSKKRSKMPKIIVTIHGLDWQRDKWGGFATKVLLRGEKQAVKYADEIIVLSKNNQKYFMNRYNKKTIFIPNGANLPNLAEANIIKEKWNLENNNYILFLARIVPEKGLHYLVEAWKQALLEIKTSKKLVIAGDSSHTNDYLKEIDFMCANDDSIIRTGFVSGKVLEELYSNAYLYVLPSDIEGMPMSLLEALSYGNRCLVSDIPENMDIINENCFSFKKANVADLKEKLVYILRYNYLERCKSYIKYQWEEVVDKTIEVYEEGE